MSNMIVCEGNLVTADAGGTPILNVLACDSGWVVVPYNSFSDQLALITTFDPVLAAANIGFCCLVFTIGFGAGIVIRNMRRL